MKKNYRRALLFAAILIFIATTPVVILYALGYRTTLTAADPLPVGVLLIETEPSQAKVYIDGTLNGQTPRSISRPAGRVSVTIEKEGYASWHKELDIEPGRATEIRDIRLFPSTTTLTTVATSVRSFSASPNRRLLAVIHKNNTVAVFDQSGEVVVPPQTFVTPITSLLWSPNSDAVLVTAANSNTVWYVSVSQRTAAAPVALPLTTPTTPVWDPRIPGRLLYQDVTHTVQAYTIQATAQVPLIPDVHTFATSASHIYAVHTTGKNLVEYTLQGQPTGTEIALPTDSAVRQLLVTPQQSITVLFEDGRVAVVNRSDKLDYLASGMSTVAWSPSGKVLLMAADTSSLYVFNVNDKRTTLPLGQLQLVQRLSRPITDPKWFAGGRHVVYSVDDAVWITETDTRDHPVSYEVDTTNTGSPQTSVGEEGEVIFYLKNTATDTTLVAAPLLIQ